MSSLSLAAAASFVFENLRALFNSCGLILGPSLCFRVHLATISQPTIGIVEIRKTSKFSLAHEKEILLDQGIVSAT